MLNILWPIFILISFFYAFFTGNIDKVNQSIFESAESSVKLTLTFLGTICLWNGMMKIASNTSFIEKINMILNPIISFLFPEIKNNLEAKKDVSMNIVANILGLGNAATPLGIKAMKTLQEDNMEKETITNSMAMFIVINTASIQIIPTTVIAIRASLNSKEPTKIIFPVWIATISATVSAIIATKLFIKIYKKRGEK